MTDAPRRFWSAHLARPPWLSCRSCESETRAGTARRQPSCCTWHVVRWVEAVAACSLPASPVSIVRMPFLVIIENLVQHQVHQQDKKLGLKMDQVARVLFPFSYLTFVSASTYSTMIEIDTHKDTAAKYLAMLICVVIVGAFLGGRVIYQWVTTKDDEEAEPKKATDSSMEPRPVYLVGAPQPDAVEVVQGLNNLTSTSPDPKTVAGETKEDASAFDFGSCMPSYGQEGLTHRTAGEGGGVAL